MEVRYIFDVCWTIDVNFTVLKMSRIRCCTFWFSITMFIFWVSLSKLYCSQFEPEGLFCRLSLLFRARLAFWTQKCFVMTKRMRKHVYMTRYNQLYNHLHLSKYGMFLNWDKPRLCKVFRWLLFVVQLSPL